MPQVERKEAFPSVALSLAIQGPPMAGMGPRMSLFVAGEGDTVLGW